MVGRCGRELLEPLAEANNQVVTLFCVVALHGAGPPFFSDVDA